MSKVKSNLKDEYLVFVNKKKSKENLNFNKSE